MKKVIYYLICLPLIIGCAPKIIDSVTYTLKGNVFWKCQKKGKVQDSFISPVFKDYLKTHTPTKVVVRVANTNKDLTQNQDINKDIDEFEKQLMNYGFDVRDRSLLLTALNSNGQYDYKKIKDLLDIDLIIEITNYTKDKGFCMESEYVDYNTKEVKPTNWESTISSQNKWSFIQVYHYEPNDYCKGYQKGQIYYEYKNRANQYNASLSKLECKIILVEKATLACSFTYNNMTDETPEINRTIRIDYYNKPIFEKYGAGECGHLWQAIVYENNNINVENKYYPKETIFSSFIKDCLLTTIKIGQ